MAGEFKTVKIKIAKNIHDNSFGHVDRCSNYGCSLLLTAFHNCARVIMESWILMSLTVFLHKGYGLGWSYKIVNPYKFSLYTVCTVLYQYEVLTSPMLSPVLTCCSKHWSPWQETERKISGFRERSKNKNSQFFLFSYTRVWQIFLVRCILSTVTCKLRGFVIWQDLSSACITLLRRASEAYRKVLNL